MISSSSPQIKEEAGSSRPLQFLILNFYSEVKKEKLKPQVWPGVPNPNFLGW
jgi:DNA-binding winged helix-turn-helix (wHTH) protein